MDGLEDFEGGCRYGCIATLLKMIIAAAFWGFLAYGVFFTMDVTYGGFVNSPLVWQYAGVLLVLILIWRIVSRPFKYFERKGYTWQETLVGFAMGGLIGLLTGGLPAVGFLIIIIYFFITQWV